MAGTEGGVGGPALDAALCRSLCEMLPFGAWATDAAGKATYVSPAFLDLLGMTLAECQAREWPGRPGPGTAGATVAAWEAAVAAGAGFEREHVFLDRHGNELHVLARGFPVRDASGAVTGWAGLNIDITGLRRLEAELAAAAGRGRVLAREADHRVRNSLALVASLLRTQAAVEPAAADLLGEAAIRVDAVAGVHEQLYSGAGEGTVEFGAFLHRLCGGILASAGAHACRVDAQELHLPGERAVALALLASELVTNAVKHGRCPGGRADLEVTLGPVGDGLWRLMVRDRGRGLPAGAVRGGFGSIVMAALASQLGAGLGHADAGPGLACTVTFPAG